MKKKQFMTALGYAIGCVGCLIGGMTMGHLAALYHHDSETDETLKEIACKDGDLNKPSWLLYAKNIWKEVCAFYKEVVF